MGQWGDVARGLVFAAPSLVVLVLIWLLQRRRMSRPWGRPVRYGRYSLRALGSVLVIALLADAAAWLGAIVQPALAGVSDSGFLVAFVMFLVWFYRARVNAEGRGWPQRRSPGLAVWAWFVPVIDFYFPFQIMADIWRAGLPEQARANRATLPGMWWASLLACLCLLTYAPASHAHRVWVVSVLIYGTGVLAVITTALLVQQVSSGPVGLKDGDAPLVSWVVHPPGAVRGEIGAGVCLETTLDRASILGTGGFGGTRGLWIPLQGPKRLIVGTDTFTVSAPQALREFVFRGSESSIAFGQAVNPDDCIMITGRAGGRQVQLAITGRNLPDIWQALAATGAAQVLRVVNSESSDRKDLGRSVLSGALGAVYGAFSSVKHRSSAVSTGWRPHRGSGAHYAPG